MIPVLSLLAGTLDVVLGLWFLIFFLLLLFIDFLVFISIIVRGTAQPDRLAASPKEAIAGQKHRNPARVEASKETRKNPAFANNLAAGFHKEPD